MSRNESNKFSKRHKNQLFTTWNIPSSVKLLQRERESESWSRLCNCHKIRLLSNFKIKAPINFSDLYDQFLVFFSKKKITDQTLKKQVNWPWKQLELHDIINEKKKPFLFWEFVAPFSAPRRLHTQTEIRRQHIKISRINLLFMELSQACAAAHTHRHNHILHLI